MKITNNILPKLDLKKIIDIVTCDDFNWFYNDKTTSLKNKTKYSYEAPQLTHTLIINKQVNSDWLSKLHPVLQIILNKKVKSIIRMKFNLLFPHKYKKNQKHCTPHIDNVGVKNYKVLLFYLEDCDSYTYFFKNKKIWKKVKVKANTLIEFDGDIYHAGSHPNKAKRKIVLNVNYIEAQ